jgi:hypothetical protein
MVRTRFCYKAKLCYAVSLTFKVATHYGDQFCKIILNPKLYKSYGPDKNPGRMDGQTTRRLYATPNIFVEHNNSTSWLSLTLTLKIVVADPGDMRACVCLVETSSHVYSSAINQRVIVSPLLTS